MTERLRLLCVFAHPDDESLGTGGMLAKYAAEGVEVTLVTATRGEYGWNGVPEIDPGPRGMGQIREGELRAAAATLGLHEVAFLDYIDGQLDQADPGEASARITAHVRRVRPHVVVTFPPDGIYGHPDHVAISQFTSAALVCAADVNCDAPGGLPPYRVPKFYYTVDSQWLVDTVAATMGRISMIIDGVERQHTGWPDWAITTRIDATAHWRTAWKAISCHQTQVQGIVQALAGVPDAAQARLWGTQTLYRVYSLVNTGRQVEDDVFVGIGPL